MFPPAQQKTLDLGVQHAPEFACLPFKILLGTYLETIEMGANTLVTSGGHGPCRPVCMPRSTTGLLRTWDIR
ncbi:hypothetical protein [Desulforamulus profundi]|uniref:hypothetical protein n=1 Tax=Desulforamulus profundi TaxID=1383067 RepID=UPI003083B073